MAQPARAPSPPIDAADPAIAAVIQRYWRRNLGVMAILLCLWAAAGLVAGILAVEWLNQFRLGGFPLGFWFAQQGSIISFVVIVFLYALVMNRLDRTHHQELELLRATARRRTERDGPA
jgi:putative solute:sodium symporter small subunit